MAQNAAIVGKGGRSWCSSVGWGGGVGGGGCSTLRVRGLAAAGVEGGGRPARGARQNTEPHESGLVLGGGVAWASDRGEALLGGGLRRLDKRVRGHG
jgi:hypothetical protein